MNDKKIMFASKMIAIVAFVTMVIPATVLAVDTPESCAAKDMVWNAQYSTCMVYTTAPATTGDNSVAGSKTSIIPCGGSGDASSPENRPCTFNDLVKLGNNVVNFLIKGFAAPFAIILFIWAGFLMMFKSSSSGSLDEARSIFWHVVVGFVIAMAAVLIIKFILFALQAKTGYQGSLGFNVVELKK